MDHRSRIRFFSVHKGLKRSSPNRLTLSRTHDCTLRIGVKQTTIVATEFAIHVNVKRLDLDRT